jgi:sugar phosphate isomerase/epimerase
MVCVRIGGYDNIFFCVKLLIEFYNVFGANPVDWIHKVKGRMDVVHLKDMAILKEQQIFAEFGEGNLNWDAIIEACRQTGVKWYVVEQDTCQRNPFESLEMSFRYLQRFVNPL